MYTRLLKADTDTHKKKVLYSSGRTIKVEFTEIDCSLNKKRRPDREMCVALSRFVRVFFDKVHN